MEGGRKGVRKWIREGSGGKDRYVRNMEEEWGSIGGKGKGW